MQRCVEGLDFISSWQNVLSDEEFLRSESQQ